MSTKKGKFHFRIRFRGAGAVLAFFLAFALLFSMIFCIEKAAFDERRDLDYQRESFELRVALSNKEAELKSLYQRHIDALGHRGTVSLMILSLNESFVDMFDQLSVVKTKSGTRRLPFVMALSRDNLPGGVGNISYDKYTALTDEGWGSCLYYTGEATAEALGVWLLDMQGELSSLNISMPKSLFCSAGYLREIDEVAKVYGISIVCVRDGTHYPLIEGTAGEGGVWHPGVYTHTTFEELKKAYSKAHPRASINQ